jgi:hypothetical protein
MPSAARYGAALYDSESAWEMRALKMLNLMRADEDTTLLSQSSR